MQITLKRCLNAGIGLLLAGFVASGCSKPNATEAPPLAPETAPDAPDAPEMPPLAPDAPGAPEMPPEIPEDADAASIDGIAVTVAEVRAMFDEHIAPHRHQIPPEQLELFWQAQMPGILEAAIERRLVSAAVRDIEVTDAEIDAKFDEIAGELPPGNTIEELTGRTRAELRDDVKEMVAFERLLENAGLVAETPTDQQIQDYYDEHADDFKIPETVQARHILLTVENPDDEAERAAKLTAIEDLRGQLLEGADFAALAGERSDCPSGREGGNLGTFGRGQMVPPFEEAAFSQAVGEIGPIVETDFGFHIVQVIERDSARTAPIEETRAHIFNRLQNEVRREHYREMLKRLRADADIRYLLP